MELIKVKEYYVAYQRQGNNRNGNPIYLVNIFIKLESGNFYNCNIRSKRKLDKYNNIRITSYNIDDSIENLISEIQ